MGELVASGILGVVAGQIQNIVTAWFKMSGERMRLIAGIKNEALIVKESAKYDTNKDNQLVRRFITFSIIGTICISMLYALMCSSEVVTSELVKRSPGLFGLLFGGTQVKVIQKLFLEHFNAFMNFGGLIVGYYMSRVRNQK
jgi:hypothetical protein